ncbi:MAG: enoyl-CoA hydratase/isomerase family protein [Acidimicrobiales bacterium]|nr:enoyl-CoA hydratase/isomerase family protein [Acidimicrobiales bacterium]
MTDPDFSLLHLDRADGVLWVTIDAPPINVMTTALARELARLSRSVAADDAVRAVVLQSANPEFFIAHFDVEAILGFPTDEPPQRKAELTGFAKMCELWRTMPKATIVKVAGRVGGGGAELSASCDMRFGLLGHTVVNQMEVPIGILPGGTGTQRLPRLLGRGRAMELVLGGVDLDAATAERWGWLNRAFATVEELDAYVDGLARRIASFPPQAVINAKAAVLAAEADPLTGLLEEAYLFDQLVPRPDAQHAMRRFLAAGGQTRDGERRVGELNAEINRP